MVEDVLNKYGEIVVAQLRDAIKAKPLPRRNGKSYVANASGNLERTLRFEVKDGVLRVYANKYIGSLIFGRRPTSAGGTGILKQRIRTWIDDKGITPYGSISKDSLAFIIARKIHKEGTLLYPQGSDLLSAIVTPALIDEIKSEIFTEIISDVFESFRTLQNKAA